LFIAKKIKWPLAAIPLFVVCSIPSLLYVFAIFNLLSLGAHILFYTGLIFMAGYIFICWKEKNIPYREIFSPGIVYFIFCFIFLYFVCRNLSHSRWDEFSHWALATKNLILTSRLVTAESAVIYKSYPPATALFHYFVTSIIGYKEGFVFFAHNLFLAAVSSALFQKMSWKQRSSLFLLFFIMSNLVFFFGGFTLQSIYADHVLAITFGVSIANYYLFSENTRLRIVYFIPVFFFIPLVKHIGFLFAMALVVLIITDQLYLFLTKSRVDAGAGL